VAGAGKGDLAFAMASMFAYICRMERLKGIVADRMCRAFGVTAERLEQAGFDREWKAFVNGMHAKAVTKPMKTEAPMRGIDWLTHDELPDVSYVQGSRDWRARLATTDNAREWLETLGVTEDAPELDAQDMGTIDFSGLFDALVDADVAAADAAAEAVEGTVALPFDGEGLPINVGDTIAKREIPKGAVVYRMSITKDGWHIDLKSNKSSASFPDVDASKCWHVEAQPTLAQILAEYGAAYAESEDKDAATSACEAMVREAVNAGR
jgi:hypothetical protein